MNKIILDLTQITDKDSLYDLITQAFDFPDYFGRNLDALYDLLTELDTDTCVGLYLPAVSDHEPTPCASCATGNEDDCAEYKTLKNDFSLYLQKLLATFTDAEYENHHLCVIVGLRPDK